MKRIALALVVGFACLLGSSSNACADWVWTKETGWINVNKSIRRSAKEIYEDARKAYDAELWKEAYDDYRLLAAYLAESKYTEESMYRSAECLYHMGRYNASFKFYKDYLFYYPGTKEIEAVLGRMHEIGKAFLAGRRYDAQLPFGFSFAFWPNRYAGIEILTHIVDNYPYVKESERVLRTIADYHFDAKEYADAIAAYEKLLALYSVGEERDWAAYRIGEAYFFAYEGPAYTHETLPKAHEAFRQYLRAFPDGSYTTAAAVMQQQARERQAEKQIRISRYYVRTHNYAAAYATLESTTRALSDTDGAKEAEALMGTLKERAEKDAAARKAKQDREEARNREERDKELAAMEKRKERLREKIQRRTRRDEEKRKERIQRDAAGGN